MYVITLLLVLLIKYALVRQCKLIMQRIALLFILLWVLSSKASGQCAGGINTFPYYEGFEADNGGWTSGGTGNDWAWGTPNKSVIAGAGGGMKCWITGGLTGNVYIDGERSWLQSPCFDLSAIQYPYIEFKVFWETEQQFDGGGFQYSIDNGTTWTDVGSAGDAKDCLNDNWFNFSPVNFLNTLSTTRDGWSGNIQPTGGSCLGGNGSSGWLTAKHTMPALAGKPGVLFRFIFGAGTICNNYDGFAIDEIRIGEAPPNSASFTYSCVNSHTVSFTNTSILCPTTFTWNFGDPASGSNNTATTAVASHTFSGAGIYTVSLTVSGSGNAPSTITRQVIIAEASVTMATAVNCQTNTGGSLLASAGPVGATLTLTWNTNPAQTGLFANNLSEGFYTVTVTGPNVCPLTATGKAEKDFSCIGIYFPSAFTPDNDGRNDGFGPLGSLSSLSGYRFSVYNRWGEKVFYSTSPFEKWNGKVNGSKTDGNVFVWLAEFILPGKPKETRRGTIVLIR
jgi:gliding motility-associated-like protein